MINSESIENANNCDNMQGGEEVKDESDVVMEEVHTPEEVKLETQTTKDTNETQSNENIGKVSSEEKDAPRPNEVVEPKTPEPTPKKSSRSRKATVVYGSETPEDRSAKRKKKSSGSHSSHSSHGGSSSSSKSKSKKKPTNTPTLPNVPLPSVKSHRDDSYYIKLNNIYFSTAIEKNDTSDTDQSAAEDFEELNQSNEMDEELIYIRNLESTLADMSWRWKWLHLNVENLSNFLIECDEKLQLLRSSEDNKCTKENIVIEDNNNNNRDDNDTTVKENNSGMIVIEDKSSMELDINSSDKHISNDTLKVCTDASEESNLSDQMVLDSEVITSEVHTHTTTIQEPNQDPTEQQTTPKSINIESNSNIEIEENVTDNNYNQKNNDNDNEKENKVADLEIKKEEEEKEESLSATGCIKNRSFIVLRKRDVISPLYLSLKRIHEIMESNRIVPKRNLGTKMYKKKHKHSAKYKKSAKFKASPKLRSPHTPTHSSDKKKLHVRRTSDFNINNIVLPASYAAPTQIRKIHYKEIYIPDFRIISEDEDDSYLEMESSSSENTDEEYYEILHHRKEVEERKRYCTPPKKIRKKKNLNLSLDSIGSNYENKNDLKVNSALACSTSAASISYPDTFFVTTDNGDNYDSELNNSNNEISLENQSNSNNNNNSNQQIKKFDAKKEESPKEKRKKTIHTKYRRKDDVHSKMNNFITHKLIALDNDLDSSPTLPLHIDNRKLNNSNNSLMFDKKRKRTNPVNWEINKKLPPVDPQTQLPKIIIYLKKIL